MPTATISVRGQIAVPKEIRIKLNLKPGMVLNVIEENGKIIAEPTVLIPSSQAYFWTKEMQKKIKDSEENFKKGNYRTTTVDELIRELDKRD